MMMKESLFLLISNVLGRGVGLGRGPLMMVKDSSFLLISIVLGRSCGARKRPTNHDEGFLVSADFKCFRKRVWGQEEAR